MTTGFDIINNRATLTDRSSSVAVGGASQLVAPAFLGRAYLFIQNQSNANESIFVNFTTNAGVFDGVSIELLPGASLEMRAPGFVTTEAVFVTAATLGHKFVYKEA